MNDDYSTDSILFNVYNSKYTIRQAEVKGKYFKDLIYDGKTYSNMTLNDMNDTKCSLYNLYEFRYKEQSIYSKLVKTFCNFKKDIFNTVVLYTNWTKFTNNKYNQELLFMNKKRMIPNSIYKTKWVYTKDKSYKTPINLEQLQIIKGFKDESTNEQRYELFTNSFNSVMNVCIDRNDKNHCLLYRLKIGNIGGKKESIKNLYCNIYNSDYIGGGGSKNINELSYVDLTRNLNMKDIILSDKFKYYFANSTYLTDGTVKGGSNDPNYYIEYRCGEHFDAPAKKFFYDSFVNVKKDSLNKSDGFISFNELAAYILDGNLLGPNFDASKYSDYHDLQINDIKGYINKLFGSNAWDSSNANYKYVYNFNNSQISNGFKLYYGRMILRGLLESGDNNRFRGYSRFFYCLINCLSFCGYDFTQTVYGKINNGVEWNVAIPETFTTNMNGNYGTIAVAKYNG